MDMSWLKKIEAKFALKAGLASGIALFLGVGLSHLTERSGPDSFISGLWSAVSALAVLQAHLGGSFKAAWLRFLGVLIGSVMGAGMTLVVGTDPISLAFSIAFTVMICSLLNLKDGISIACVTVNVVMILWGLRPELSPWVFALFRFMDSCLGILVAITVSYTIWPARVTEKMRVNMSQILSSLHQLYFQAVSAEPIVQNAHIVIASRVQRLLQENLFLLEEAKVELFIRPDMFNHWELLQGDLEHAFRIALSLQRISRNGIEKIFDESLRHSVEKIAHKINQAFQQLAQQLWTGHSEATFPDIPGALEHLENDLIRFRGTHATRKFELQEVENFFVFFYRHRVIAEEIERIAKTISALGVAQK